jgi:hypothetical protein
MRERKEPLRGAFRFIGREVLAPGHVVDPEIKPDAAFQ